MKKFENIIDNYINGNIADCKAQVKKLSKAQYIADKREAYSPTHHGIITIDYTNAEPIEIKIMYSNELKTLTIIQSIIYSIYTFVPFLIYIIFMMKMISNLYY